MLFLYIFRRVADICVIFEFLEVNIARGRVSSFVDYDLYTVHQCLHSHSDFPCVFCTRTLETPWRVSSATSLRTPSWTWNTSMLLIFLLALLGSRCWLLPCMTVIRWDLVLQTCRMCVCMRLCVHVCVSVCVCACLCVYVQVVCIFACACVHA